MTLVLWTFCKLHTPWVWRISRSEYRIKRFYFFSLTGLREPAEVRNRNEFVNRYFSMFPFMSEYVLVSKWRLWMPGDALTHMQKILLANKIAHKQAFVQCPLPPSPPLPSLSFTHTHPHLFFCSAPPRCCGLSAFWCNRRQISVIRGYYSLALGCSQQPGTLLGITMGSCASRYVIIRLK